MAKPCLYAFRTDQHRSPSHLAKLAENDHLRGLSREAFVPALAKLHGELNQLDTFPEGNGQTQRLFLEQCAAHEGYRVDLSIGTRYRITEASIAQTEGLHGMIERFIAEAADPNRVKACAKP